MKSLPVALLCGVLLAGIANAQAPAPGHPRETRGAPPAGPPKAADCGALPASLDGTAFAVDGNTLVLAGHKAPLTIWGIQAPELRDKDRIETVAGMRARAALEDLLEKAGRKVKCRPLKWEAECRMVAQCATGTSIDVGGYMVSSGMAYGWRLDEALPWEARAGQRYGTAEAEAREKKLGLWPLWLGKNSGLLLGRHARRRGGFEIVVGQQMQRQKEQRGGKQAPSQPRRKRFVHPFASDACGCHRWDGGSALARQPGQQTSRDRLRLRRLPVSFGKLCDRRRERLDRGFPG